MKETLGSFYQRCIRIFVWFIIILLFMYWKCCVRWISSPTHRKQSFQTHTQQFLKTSRVNYKIPFAFIRLIIMMTLSFGDHIDHMRQNQSHFQKFDSKKGSALGKPKGIRKIQKDVARFKKSHTSCDHVIIPGKGVMWWCDVMICFDQISSTWGFRRTTWGFSRNNLCFLRNEREKPGKKVCTF